MAEVYVAKTRGIGGFEKLVAIKLIHPRFSEDEHFVQMLVEEAKLSVLLTHANIGQTFDLGRIEGGPYFIVMEYIEGADAYKLQQRLAKEGGQLPLDIAAFIVAEVCQGLDYAHRKSDVRGAPLHIVHRDISPQNVLISFSGEVKIVDFGIAKAAMRGGETDVGVIKGKYYYMSPEQAWADPVDHRSDIFSTGVVLHELLTGEMLYQGSNLPELLDRVRKADIAPPSRRRPEVPPELDAIVMKALARHPSERYRSAHAFAQALTQFLHKTSPGFTPARLATLMSRLFAGELLETRGEQPLAASKKVPSGPRAREATGSLEAMRPEEYRPDVTKSVIFDLREFDDERTRDEKRRRRPAAIEVDEADATDEDQTIVQASHASWADEATEVTPEVLRATPHGEAAAPSGTEEEPWGDATMVDDAENLMGRMREALAREVAVRNKSRAAIGSAGVAPPAAMGSAPPTAGAGRAAPPARRPPPPPAGAEPRAAWEELDLVPLDGPGAPRGLAAAELLSGGRDDRWAGVPSWARWVALGLALTALGLLVLLLRAL